MFLHLGSDVVIKTEDIVGIFDLDTASVSKWTRDFLSAAQKNNRVINVSYELPKSFIVAAKENKKFDFSYGNENVYLSQISAATLLKRINTLSREEKEFKATVYGKEKEKKICS